MEECEPREDEALIARVARLADGMSAGLVERDNAARLVLLAALAGEHSLLVGPPGTAKSELARRLRACVAGGGYFERLLTRFSVPEELFGPLSIKHLEEDRYHRLTDGYLPTASVAFLDEIFKANSAILNSLLTLLNEREFDNGTERARTPLVSVVAASNEIPDDAELAALHDRFLVRVHVAPVSSASFDALLAYEAPGAPAVALTPEDLAAIRERSRRVVVPSGIAAILKTIRSTLAEKSIYVSDRRWVKIVQLLRVAAYTDRRSSISLAHLGLVTHCLWGRPEQREAVEQIVRGALDAALVEEPPRLAKLAEELEKTVRDERACTRPRVDGHGRLVFRDDAGRETINAISKKKISTLNGDPLYIPPPEMKARGAMRFFTYTQLWNKHFALQPDGLRALERWTASERNQADEELAREPVLEPMAYSAEHVRAREAQVSQIASDARALLDGIERRLGDEREPSLWPVGNVGAAWIEKLSAARTALAPIAARLERVRSDVAALRCEAP